MQKRTAYIITIVIVLIIALPLWMYLHNPRRMVRKRLESLVELMDFNEETGQVTKGLKIQKLNEYLAPQVVLYTPIELLNGTLSRSEVVEVYKAVITHARAASVSFENLKFIDVNSESCSFEADVAGWMEAGAPERYTEAFHAKGMAVKTEGKWRFTSCRKTD